MLRRTSASSVEPSMPVAIARRLGRAQAEPDVPARRADAPDRRRRRIPPAGLVVAASVLCAGCSGIAAQAFNRDGQDSSCSPSFLSLPAGGQGCASLLVPAEPAAASDVPGALAGPIIQETFADGALWLGYNVATAQGGNLDPYDSGHGMSFGIAFGNGQDEKRLVEFTYESTGGHRAYNDTGDQLSNASHERYSVGIRQYLFPVAQEKGRVVPFMTSGVTYQLLKGGSPPVGSEPYVPTKHGNILETEGVGVYLGTGIEMYLGARGQFSVALDVRGSFVCYDSYPEGTGRSGTVGGSMGLVYHF